MRGVNVACVRAVQVLSCIGRGATAATLIREQPRPKPTIGSNREPHPFIADFINGIDPTRTLCGLAGLDRQPIELNVFTTSRETAGSQDRFPQ
jgi:hypothetical protein